MIAVNLTCECADWQSVISSGCSQWEVPKDEFGCLCVCVQSKRAQPFENFQTCFVTHFGVCSFIRGNSFAAMDEACIKFTV